MTEKTAEVGDRIADLLHRAATVRGDTPDGEWADWDDETRGFLREEARTLLGSGVFSALNVFVILGVPQWITRRMPEARGNNTRRGGAINPDDLREIADLRAHARDRGRSGRYSERTRALAIGVLERGTSAGTVSRLTGIPTRRLEKWSQWSRS